MLVLLLQGLVCFLGAARAQRPDKDYLSALEADKIRDAETPNERIALFLRLPTTA